MGGGKGRSRRGRGQKKGTGKQSSLAFSACCLCDRVPGKEDPCSQLLWALMDRTAGLTSLHQTPCVPLSPLANDKDATASIPITKMLGLNLGAPAALRSLCSRDLGWRGLPFPAVLGTLYLHQDVLRPLPCHGVISVCKCVVIGITR